MAENIVVDFIEKGIHNRTSYAWKCYYNVIFQLKELIKVKKVKPYRFFFLSFPPFFCDVNAKKLGRSDDAKRRKKGGIPF